jgi:hypothetical protein
VLWAKKLDGIGTGGHSLTLEKILSSSVERVRGSAILVEPLSRNEEQFRRPTDVPPPIERLQISISI